MFGARNVADPPPDPLPGPPGPLPGRADVNPSPVAATSCGFAYPARCSTRASSAAVWPRAPHSAIRSALATLAGEKTVSGGVGRQHLVQIHAERRVSRRGLPDAGPAHRGRPPPGRRC